MVPLKGMSSPISKKQVIPSHNPIQLAAISNYKLAQLTFAPPDLHSLRKTAVIKNMLQDVYTSTPAEWLQQMTEWQYFTPESLEEMTQEGLEEIFAQYAQTIEAFRPIKQTSYHYEDELFEDEDDGQGDDLWIAEDELETATIIQPPTPALLEVKPSSLTPPASVDSIFSQPNATLSNESLEFPVRAPSPLSEKPLPANPIVNDDTAKQARRKSGFGGNKNRLSWTSDTGITSSVVSQNLANEIMSLFDMDFAVDIKVDTAPKLPELPFKPRTRSQHRQSQDMLTSLIPAFEKIALENSTDFFAASPQLFPSPPSVVPPPQKSKPNLIIQSVPKRSSSLRHRQEVLSADANKAPITPPATPDSPVDSKGLSKKKSLLRLASLINTKKMSSKDMPHSPEASPIQQGGANYFHNHETTVIQNTPRKTSTSTVDSSSSSSWSFVSDAEYKSYPRPQKPLPEPPKSPDFSPSVRDDYVSGDESNNSKSLRQHKSKKKRKSVMEKTMAKRKSNNGLQSIYDAAKVEEKGLGRSKSAFIKIGNGIKNKKHLKQIRRTSSAKNLTENTPYQFNYHTTNDVNQLYEQPSEETISSINNTSFVKRMTSFNWRIKSRHNKPVAV
ncbi:unnamed protein product [Mucor hiemalis]